MKTVSQQILETVSNSKSVDGSKVALVLAKLYNAMPNIFTFCPIKSGVEKIDEVEYLVVYDFEEIESDAIDMFLSNVYNEGINIEMDEYSLDTVNKRLITPIKEIQGDDDDWYDY